MVEGLAIIDANLKAGVKHVLIFKGMLTPALFMLSDSMVILVHVIINF